MHSIWHAIGEALQTQVGGGVIALSLVGSAFALLRTLPGRLMSLLRRQFIVSVDIVGGDPLFAWVIILLDSLPYSRRSRLLTGSGLDSGGRRLPSEGDTPSLLLTPGPGEHMFWYQGRPVWLSRQREKGELGGYRESVTLRMLGRSQAGVRQFLEEARRMANRQERRVGVHVLRYGDWHRFMDLPPRSVDSVVLPAGMMEGLLEDARTFFDARALYEQRGIPWRRGYLFEGPPGTGKTSAITAIAADLGLDLYIFPVAAPNMTDERLLATLLLVPERSAVLLEDVDGIASGREMQTEGVTFSGLLNALNGVASRPGIITFLTSNHPERLDPALVRPGRVDVRRHFGNATPDQAARRFEQFFGKHEGARVFGATMAGKSMADVQAVLLDHWDDPAGALRDVSATPVRRVAA